MRRWGGVLLWLVACGDEAPATGATRAVTPAPAPPPAACEPPSAFRVAQEAVVSPLAVALTPELAHAREILVAIVQDHARDPENPWAVAHALLALGPDVVLTNGRPATDWLFETYAVRDGVGVSFPARRGSIRIEPHTDLILKALTESGQSPERRVTVEGQPATLGDLYRQSLCALWVDGDRVSVDSWNDTPWALQSLATWAPKDLTWTVQGHPMSVHALTDGTVRKLRSETAFLRSAMASGAQVQKRGQGIFAYTCGGAHLLQGASWAVGQGFGDPALRDVIAEEIGVHVHRVQIELGAVDAAIAQYPQHTVRLTVQRLKFLGHFLETVHKAAAFGLVTPTDSQAAEIARANLELARTVDALERTGALGTLTALRAADEQLYLDIVGDAAHAVRGLDLATGTGVVLR